MCTREQEYQLWASGDRGVYCGPPGAQEELIRFTQDSGCLLGDWEDSRSLLCARESRESIVCLTWQGYLLCASRDRGVYRVPPGAHDDLMRFTKDSGCLLGAWEDSNLGIYCVHERAGVSIVSLRGQGCLLWASWDTGYPICASHGSGCLFCAQQGTGCLLWASWGTGGANTFHTR